MNRWRDWWQQAQRDLKAARASLEAGFYEWAAFQAQQGAEKALKALALRRGGQPWGHSLSRLAKELGAPEDVSEACERLDLLYGHPGEFFGPTQAEEALSLAKKVVEWVRDNLG